ncbi:hypothetical protein [Tsukamurella strandjordii]|uniref:Uncharacterized protein n=1 Tax=Tsukamurella strandjordii TaxID=147577 RepID=A0AA90SLR5_9ACTN|nr:hypothetical protein [Tsukamurella strandjordii]MDP0398542.1 hypothetical protein [Tsukamurella strandjordii]
MSNFTTREVAETLDTDAKTFRKFLRSVGYDKRAEEGRARYAFDSKDVTALTEQYAAYIARETATDAEPANPFADAIAAYDKLTDKQRMAAENRLNDIDMNLNCNAAGSGRFEHVIVAMIEVARKAKRPVAKLTDAQVNDIIEASA